jgi:hypothetical protein
MDNWMKYVYYWMVKGNWTAEEMAVYFPEESTGKWQSRLKPWPRNGLSKGQEEMTLQESIEMRHLSIQLKKLVDKSEIKVII